DVNDLYALNFTNGIRVTDILGDLNVVNVNNSTAGDIKITSDGNMNLGQVMANTSNGPNEIFLTSNQGSILDGNGSIINLTADTVKLVAKNGIGTNSDSLEIRPYAINGILNLIASNWNDGGIHLSQTAGDLNVMIANANLGDIILDAYGDILLGKDTNPAVSGLTAHNGLVSLISNNGEIVDFNGDNWNIDSDSIFLSAINGIGSGDTIEVHTHNLSAYNSTSGNIQVRDINGDFYVDSVINDASNGSVYLTASGLNNATPGWDNKEMYLGTVKSKNGVYLEATNGAIADNNGSALNIDSLYTSLLAYRGIGTASDAIETKVDAIDFANIALGDVNIENSVNTVSTLTLGNANAWNTGTGNIFVRELVGNMIAGGSWTGIIASGGAVDLYSQGDMFLNYVKADGTIDIETLTGDLIFGTPGALYAVVESYNSGVNLLANNGSVAVNSLQTTPHIIANGDSSILTPHGKITPTGTPLDVDITGTLSVDLTNYQISNIVNAVIPPPMDVFGNMTGTITGGIMIPLLTGTLNPAPLNPPGYVYYNGVQIWPPKMFGPSGAGSDKILASAEKIDKAYWEILEPYRYASFSQATPVFYLYHPLNETDEEAFEDINLDADAYEFIEENINLKKERELDPYFGWLDDQDTNQDLI
ncbi:MAG: hypothetical protein PHY73_04970, partial [Candidatus Omnitrophica bacterium]|nr:hypothetical protein [Candidatus Omnitrophota bacterium]